MKDQDKISLGNYLSVAVERVDWESSCQGLNPYVTACWLSQEALTTNYFQPFS